MTDLSFSDCTLELEFQQHLKARRQRVALQFAAFRCGCLLLMALWALVQEAWLWVCAAVDVVQASIGCLQHRHISPSQEGLGPAGSLIYLLGGTTVLYRQGSFQRSTQVRSERHMFAFLPFRVQFVSQMAVCQIQLACNGRLCAGSLDLRAGYRTLGALFGRICGGWLEAAHKVLAATADCAKGAALAAGTAGGDDLQRCVAGQASLLLFLGFMGAMWVTCHTELGSGKPSWLSWAAASLPGSAGRRLP
ncbi:hypothetical protein ABPG75_008810 [Micractinium tetrahymenae]